MSWKYRLLLAILVLINIVLFWRSCEDPMPVKIKIEKVPYPVTILKDSIVLQEKEVIKWKKRKDSINYSTIFDTVKVKSDTLANQVFKELVKCDSIVKIDSIINAKKDTIIKEQKKIIVLDSAQIDMLNKQLKKEKKKTTFFEIISGISLFLNIVK